MLEGMNIYVRGEGCGVVSRLLLEVMAEVPVRLPKGRRRTIGGSSVDKGC